MANKRIHVDIGQKELDFVEWLAKQDGMTMNCYINDGYYQEGKKQWQQVKHKSRQQ